MKYLFISILTLMISSCETDFGKYGGYEIEYDSELDYYIVLDKGEEIYGDDAADIVKKGTIVKYYRVSGKVDSALLGKGSIIIESFVDNDDVCFDETFIIVKQKPLKSICECNDSCLANKYRDKNNLPTYKMCKEALEKSVNYQYWIINKIHNNIYGPMTKQEYLVLRKELKVPHKLQTSKI